MKRSTPLRPRSTHPAARARREALAQAQHEARERWGWTCTVPGCRRIGTHLHHAYARSIRPEHRAAVWNLIPLCPGHHQQAQRPDHWLYDALREVADEARAAAEGRRPWPGRSEAAEILRRHREEAERPYVSPIGTSG